MAWRPGLNHIEFWVSSLERSVPFYDDLFSLIRWKKLSQTAYSSGSVEIYLVEKRNMERRDALGPRHLCFQATSREMVDEVGRWLKERDHTVIRGPLEQSYSEEYYTVDFRDPDGYILEVAYTPNMEI